MPAVSGAASYKKKPGTLTVSADGSTATWTAKGDAQPSVKIDVACVTGMAVREL